jgi:hypothetical protein
MQGCVKMWNWVKTVDAGFVLPDLTPSENYWYRHAFSWGEMMLHEIRQRKHLVLFIRMDG